MTVGVGDVAPRSSDVGRSLGRSRQKSAISKVILGIRKARNV